MWDHARSFATLAPLLAPRFRCIAIDMRGHGDSDWAGAYTWLTEVQDLVHVLQAIGQPVHMLSLIHISEPTRP